MATTSHRPPSTSARGGRHAAAAGPGSSSKGRAVWIIADQAMSSLANAALTFVLASTVSPGEYGAFALAFSVYSLVVSLVQGISGQVVVIRYSAEDRPTQIRAGAAAGGAAVLAGVVAAVVSCGSVLFADADLRQVMLVMGVLLPALVLQDTWRTVFIARGEPKAAFWNDLLWTALQAVGIGVLIWIGIEKAWPYVAVWAGAALVAALVGVRQNETAPTFRTTARWLTGHREVSVPSLANSLAIIGAMQIALVLIASLGSVEDVGALRAAQTLLGPLNIIGFAATAFVVPEIIRRDLGKAGLVRAAIAVSVVLVMVDAAWGACLLLLPDSVGSALLGETWASAKTTLPAMVAFTCLIGAAVGPITIMRALNRSNLAFWVSAMLGPLVLVLSVIGVRIDGAAGAATGFAVAAGVVLPPTCLLMARAVRLGRREVPADEVVADDDDGIPGSARAEASTPAPGTRS